MGRKTNREKNASSGESTRAPHSSAIASDLWQRLWNLITQFRETDDADKVLKSALRMSLEYFAAREGCVVHIPPEQDAAAIVPFTLGSSHWDLHLLGKYLRGGEVTLPDDLMIARIRRNGRVWGALVLRLIGRYFDWKDRQAFSAVTAATTYLIERIDRDRARQIRTKINDEILAQRRPKDLFYKLLHGIRSLTAYDHSSSLLTFNHDFTAVELVAEQIAWRKAKSQRVGLKVPISATHRKMLTGSKVAAFDRRSARWLARDSSADATLAELLDFGPLLDPSGDIEPPVECVLFAPLVTRDGPLGVLKVAARCPERLGDFEVELVSQFLPQAAVILRNLKRTESLEMQVLAAERKHAMADLARGVSHDVNNALGAVLPLVQQLQEDLESGQWNREEATSDLRAIERSLQVCRRIFGGMLGFARSAAKNPSEVHLFHEVDTTLGILREGLTKRGIELHVQVPRSLPALQAVQADIEQLLLNLIGNARDAMKAGDRLSISAREHEGAIELLVKDTGCGIPAAHLAKVQEPFFTTKSSGNGLGLAICRSIVSEMRGSLHIESEVGVGTSVRVSLPLLEDQV